ncbi:hypothetical protein A311_03797 [Escherichia coli KTE146]|nr:hypothetical protein A311_03797 [Escherichia coli KTE146]
MSSMKNFITEQQKAELERLHNSNRNGRVRDRIKAILLGYEGWSSAMIAQALRLHQITIAHHTRDVIAFVTRTWSIIFNIPGMNK